jgi:cytochrome c biogenesis protein CcmG/thiol:disulfide interchange protein DsbE
MPLPTSHPSLPERGFAHRGNATSTATQTESDAGVESRRNRSRQFGVLAILGLVVVVLAAAGQQGQEASASRPNAPAPAFDVARLDQPGERLRLADYRGKPVLVNFWASWCVPCRQEMPELQAMRDRYGGRLEVVGINMWDTPTDAKALLVELGVTYPQAIDSDSTIVADFGIDTVPSTAFITADGRFAAVASGKPSPAELQEMVTEHLGL